MTMDPAFKKKLIAKLIEYEGIVPHLYLDGMGKVTVGIGHLVINKPAMNRIRMFTLRNRLPGRLATDKEKQAEYDLIDALPKNRPAGFYKKHATLMMKRTDIDALKISDISQFYGELTAYFTKANGYASEFKDMPEPVRLAIFDIVFNTGLTKFDAQFRNFKAALKAEDWKTAAKESRRDPSQIQAGRNDYVRQLLEGAALRSPALIGGVK